MNLTIVPAAFDVLRKGGAVEDAIKHRSASALGTAISLLVVALINIVKGTSYGSYVSFVTPEMATQLGLAIAGACVAWGHWATSPDVGILPAKPADAGPARNAPAPRAGEPAAAAGSPPADAQPSVEVRNGGDAAQAPDGYLRG